MTTPTVYKPSAIAPGLRAPLGNGYPGFAPAVAYLPAPAMASFAESAAQSTPPVPAAPAGFQSQPPLPAAQAPMNVLAVIAFITSLIGFGVIPIVLGIIGLGQINKKGERGRGFGIAGIVIGAVTVGGFIVLSVLVVVIYMVGGAMFEASYNA